MDNEQLIISMQRELGGLSENIRFLTQAVKELREDLKNIPCADQQKQLDKIKQDITFSKGFVSAISLISSILGGALTLFFNWFVNKH